ncbi:MAG: response regulator [Campylobacterota bacterium]|nr:response regulator [Campylobacterota bacterium]
MFDKEFLKTLTIMYVEDDDSIRNSLSSILKKIFGEVIICNDGNDGINQFKYYTQERKTKIDSIISDINMPNLNGIEMVKEIRELDPEVPIVFTTAHGESSYLMEAIKLKIAYYALKPINTTELLQNVSKFCTAEHNKMLIQKREQELAQYMAIMDQIAAMFKVDEEGNITEVNDLLIEVSGYSKEELLSLNMNQLLHKDSTTNSYDEIIKLIGDKDEYKGKIKFKSKEDKVFYLNSTIIPRHNDATGVLIGLVYIGLDQTGDELEKQQTMQRVRKSIIEQRTKESGLGDKIKELENEIKKLHSAAVNSKDADFMIDTLNKEKQKVSTLNAQILHYEKELASLTKHKDLIVSEEKNKKLEMMKRVKELSKENHTLQSKVIELQAMITKTEEQKRGTTVG